MKALILTKNTLKTPTTVGYAEFCYAALQSMNIDYGHDVDTQFTTFSAADAASINAVYDFIVVPQNNGGFNAVIDDSNITIPIMLLGGDGSSASGIYGASAPGVSGSPSALGDNWVETSWTSERWFAIFSRAFVLDGGTSLVTVASNSPLDESANANAGRTVMWSSPMAGGSRFYASSTSGSLIPVLHLLVQAAVDDGEITLDASFRRSPMCMDLDHINGTDGTAGVMAEPTILDKIASYVPAGGVIWGGIHNKSTSLGVMTDEVAAKLLQHSHPNGPFKYCWHDHTFSPIVGANLDAQGYSTDVTKQQQYDKYVEDEATWNSHGLEFHTPAYYNSGSNSWDEATLELFSADVSSLSSPGNDTVQAGFGFTVFRQNGENIASRVTDGRKELFVNQHKTQRKVRGILLVTTWDQALDDDVPGSQYDAISDWRDNFRNIMQTAALGMTVYLHDQDFIAADQDPGISGKHHGYTAMQLFTDTGLYLKDVAKVFADPTDYTH